MSAAEIDGSGVTHAIVLVCGGDSDLTDFMQENLDEIKQYFERFKQQPGQHPHSFAVLALADFHSRPAELHWYSGSAKQKVWRLGELNTGDPHVIGRYLAGALRALSSVPRVAIGFSGHGTGVLDEERPHRGDRRLERLRHIVEQALAEARPEFDAALSRDLSDADEAQLRTMLEKVGSDLDPVTEVTAFEKLEHLLPLDDVPWEAPSATSSTDTQEDWLTTTEITMVLQDARTYSRRTSGVDLLFFDSCFNGMVEVAYQCRRHAEVFIGSMNEEPKTLWDYGIWLEWMEAAPPPDADAWADIALRAFQEAARVPPRKGLPDDAFHTWALTAVRTDRLAAIYRAFSNLLKCLENLPFIEVVHKALRAAERYGNPRIRDMVDFTYWLESEVKALDGRSDSLRSLQEACRELRQSASKALVSPAPMVVAGQGNDRLDPRRVHGLAFWGPVDRDSFYADCENYAGLEFAETGWGKYLGAQMERPPVRRP